MREDAIGDGTQAAVRARQQAAVARLGQQALSGSGLEDLLEEGTASTAREMNADYAKLLELLPQSNLLLMRAGVGWEKGLVGSALVEAGDGSQAGYTLLSKEPVILEEAASEKRFRLAALHQTHRITSGVTVVIPGDERPFGILGVYTRERRHFSQDDVNFLQSMANVLAAAIERKRSEEERERLLEEMRHLAETAQRRAAELQSVLDNMLDGVFVTDQRRRAVLVNSAGARMLGLQEIPASLDVQPLLRIRRANGNSYGEDHPLLRALAGQTVAMEDAIVAGDDGQPEINVRVNAAPIRDENGNVVGAVALTRDVTAIADLERLKEQFISMAAHELKTPVAVMKGYAQALLKMGDTIPPSGIKMLAAIDRGSDRIDRIVKDLLDISRFHVGRLDLGVDNVDLTDLAGSVARRMAMTAKKHDIAVHGNGGIAVLADRARVEQVLASLVDNAIKYSPDGENVEVLVEAVGREAVVSVIDHGIGIPPNKQNGIFQLFYRAHAGTPRDYGGMGVGLYISKEIVDRLGGRIWFESEEESGSSFHFSLPLARSESVEG